VNTTTALGTRLVLGYGALLSLQHKLTVGELLILLSYIGSVALGGPYRQLHDVQTGRVKRRLQVALDAQPAALS
jgi:hypothetical protein